MTEPQPVGGILDGLLEQVIFENPDPRVQRIRKQWNESRAEADALLAAACEENYRTRLDYHRKCGERNAEELARGDAAALRQLCMEEYDDRLAGIWADTTERVRRVLEDLKEERDGA